MGGARWPLGHGKDGGVRCLDSVGEALCEARIWWVRLPVQVQIQASVVRHAVDRTLVDAGTRACCQDAGGLAFFGHELSMWTRALTFVLPVAAFVTTNPP